MIVNPSVAFPTNGNPERLINKEHAAPALVMVALSCAHALAQQPEIHLAPFVLWEPKPFPPLGLVEALLFCPRGSAAERITR